MFTFTAPDGTYWESRISTEEEMALLKRNAFIDYESSRLDFSLAHSRRRDCEEDCKINEEDWAWDSAYARFLDLSFPIDRVGILFTNAMAIRDRIFNTRLSAVLANEQEEKKRYREEISRRRSAEKAARDLRRANRFSRQMDPGGQRADLLDQYRRHKEVADGALSLPDDRIAPDFYPSCSLAHEFSIMRGFSSRLPNMDEQEWGTWEITPTDTRCQEENSWS